MIGQDEAPRPQLSVVTTLYRSESTLADFLDRTIRACQELGVTFEIVIVDDGSPDRSLQIAIERKRMCDQLVIVEFSRNFGHHLALLAGMSMARGQRVFLIDSDLEEAPELVKTFWSRAEELGSEIDVIYGIQKRRKGGFFESKIGGAFYRAFNYFSNLKIPMDVTTARIMSRRFVDAVTAYREYSVFLLGLMTDAGFRTTTLQVEKGLKGYTSYSPARRFRIAVAAMVDYGIFPLRWFVWVGSVIAFSAFVFIMFVIVRGVVTGTSWHTGFASTFLMLTLIFGFQVLSTGVVGIFLQRIYTDTKGRPRWIIRNIH